MRDEGVPDEIIESFLVQEEKEVVEIWGQNSLPFLILVRCRRCWIYEMGQRVGLNWLQINQIIERMNIWREASVEEKDLAYDALDIIESTALETWQELSDSN